jgi:hypothetical protein
LQAELARLRQLVAELLLANQELRNQELRPGSRLDRQAVKAEQS